MTKEFDDKAFDPRYDGLSSEKHKKLADDHLRTAIEELFRAEVTTAGVAIGGFMGAATGVGMATEDSIMKEILVGAGAGMAVGDTIGEKIAGEKKAGGKIKILNPYDGTVTEVEINTRGLSMDNPILKFVRSNTVLEADDWRLRGLIGTDIKYDIDRQLIDAARKNRNELERKAAQKRAELYEEAMRNRRDSSSGGS
jgi:hypothetical protein